ncbi:MAG: (2Fe-2S)-binding protein [Pirellulales bacterium]|nr:(2Fe-2S)-binding protein [Pirellulales bacterium]
MVRLTIDNHEIEVAPGATLLDAAEQLGIDIPTLCYLKGYKPSTSCLVCMVKDCQTGRLVPACATPAVDGMTIESESEELALVRRTALELLLSDHAGDCLAPCYFACPAHMDIPRMLHQIGEQSIRDAIATIKKDIALPAVLGRICSKPCEKGCRRGAADGPAAICELKRFVADADLASADPYAPDCQPPTGKRVAIIGAGPTGLAAAYELAQAGHACMLFDDQPKPGGRLRTEFHGQDLPEDVLDAEIHQILRLGIDLRSNCQIGAITLDSSLSALMPLDDMHPKFRLHAKHGSTCNDLSGAFDAVLVAWGATDPKQVERRGFQATQRGLAIDQNTYVTNRPGIFAAGNAVRGSGLVVRSVADGKEAAQSMIDYLAGRPIRNHGRIFSSRMGRLSPEEMADVLSRASSAARSEPDCGAAFQLDAATEQANRCLSCGCIAHNHCKLERYARIYGADPRRFGVQRPAHRVIGRGGSVLFEPGKCIKCELCVQIAEQAGEPLGLTFVGRGFDVRLQVPFDGSLDDALTQVAAACIAACPTAALTFAHQHRNPELVTLKTE